MLNTILWIIAGVSVFAATMGIRSKEPWAEKPFVGVVRGIAIVLLLVATIMLSIRSCQSSGYTVDDSDSIDYYPGARRH